mgnify:CR=1 FL=1
MFKKTGKIKVSFGILFIILLIISVAGCIKKSSGGAEYFEATGTKGLAINFLENYPQDNYLVSQGEEPIVIIVGVENKGAFPQEGDLSKWSNVKEAEIKLSGLDNNIISIPPSKRISDWKSFPGASYVNPEGSFDTAEFAGNIHADKIKVNKYEPTILATICYPYSTKASPAVCVDPHPFDGQDKVCEIGSKQLTSQGAPIAITRIDEEASTNKIQFKIYVKNVGGGDVIKLAALERCSLVDKGLEKDDFNSVELVSAAIGPTSLNCMPFADGSSNLIQLFNGEGFVICSLDTSNLGAESAYMTPFNIELRYGYMSTISKNIKISKLTGVS